MMYVIKMADGRKFKIPESEARNITKAKGQVFVPSLNGFLNLSYSTSILPESVDLDLTVKYLHDGTPVVSMGGKWRIRGHEDVEIDEKKYPEILNEMLLLKSISDEQSSRNISKNSQR